MQRKTELPLGLAVIYFKEGNKSIYVKLPFDKDLAKRLSKRIYKDAMTALSDKTISNKT